MLQPGDLIPHFSVTALDGRTVEYSTIWQRRNLVLITLPASDSASSRVYVSQLAADLPGFSDQDTEWIVTKDVVAGLARPGAVVADRWGEIVHVAAGSDVDDLPRPSELFQWVAYLQIQCPECQGEAK